MGIVSSLSTRRTCAPCHHQAPDKDADDGDVVDDVERRAWTDSDHDREDPNQRAHEREALSRQPRSTRRGRSYPGQRRTRKKRDCDHGFSNASLAMFIAGD